MKAAAYLLDKKEITSESAFNPYIIRAKRKALCDEMMLQLAALQSPLEEKYRYTLICQKEVEKCYNSYTGEEKLQVMHCNSRWCTTCSSRRTAELIDAYLPALKNMANPYLVTLTKKAVSITYKDITGAYTDMQSAFRKIKDTMRKRGCSLNGIRKWECNYNLQQETANPHFHVLVDGYMEAHTLKSLWLEHDEQLSPKAQHIGKADEGSLQELFKYTAKQICNTETFNAYAVDTIYQAIDKKRTLQNFGSFKKSPVSSQNDEEDINLSAEEIEAEKGNWEVVDVYKWDIHRYNWFNSRGESLVRMLTAEEIERAAAIKRQRMQLVSLE